MIVTLDLGQAVTYVVILEGSCCRIVPGFDNEWFAISVRDRGFLVLGCSVIQGAKVKLAF